MAVMMRAQPTDRRQFLKLAGTLVVSISVPSSLLPAPAAAPFAHRWPAVVPADMVDSFLAIGADGTVTVYCGHVDLGTGVRTALAQIVAEELDVSMGRVNVVLGDTDKTPDQGPTIASDTIQVTAIPLRRAAAEARRFLVARAAQSLNVPPAQLTVADGVVSEQHNPARSVAYGTLVQGRSFDLRLPGNAPVKKPSEYKIVGKRVPRVDIPVKVTGALTFVHDLWLPGMLHGRVVRPPVPGVETSPAIGATLVSVDRHSIEHIPGVVEVVVNGDFVGVIVEREENAERAARELKVAWKPWREGLADFSDLERAIRQHPSKPRVLNDEGDVVSALASAARSLSATYIWPYQMHGSIGPSCAVADVREGQCTVWSGTQNPHVLRRDIAALLKMPLESVRVLRMEAAGCYGRNCADDVAGDAALLSRAVGRPVRVQLSRADEHGWEPKGAAQLVDVRGGLDADGTVAAYDFNTRWLSGAADTLPLLLTGIRPAKPSVNTMGDRTALPAYYNRYGSSPGFRHCRVVVNDAVPPVRAAWLRGVAAMPNVLAHESFMDELATAAGADAIEFRLRHLADERGAAVLKAAAERAGWQSRPSFQDTDPGADVVRGRGAAYGRYIHSPFPGYGAAWVAWVCEVAVDRATGGIRVTRVVVAQDCGLIVNPDGVRHQVHGNVIQSISRVLKEAVTFDRSGVTSLDWAAYPILTFPEVPEIETVLIDRPEQPALGVGEAASVPSAAAIANAVFDATGVRLREVPFTAPRVRARLQRGDSRT
jgi:nicotinate dehydrogenase subunit B